jgi:hypothetical protein
MSYSTIDEEDPFARAEMLPAYLPAYTAGGDGGYADEKEKDGPPPDIDGGYGIGFGHTQWKQLCVFVLRLLLYCEMSFFRDMHPTWQMHCWSRSSWQLVSYSMPFKACV